MPTWKKVIVSGSNANLTALQVDNLTSGQVVIGGGASNLSTTAINGTGTIVATTDASGLSHSGSFSGSFQGTFSGTVSGTAATASFVTASGVFGPYGANSVVSASHAVTASHAINAASASFITGSNVFGPFGANSVISASHAVQAAATVGTLTFGEGLTSGTFNGSSNVTLTVSGAAQLTDNAITKWNDTDNKFVVSSLTDNGTAVTGATSIQLSGANSSLTGSFTGSFVGNGSGLTGLATTLTVSGSSGAGGTTISLGSQTLNIIGTANQIATSASAQTVTISLPSNVTIPNNLTVEGDLYVNGTTTTVNTADLYIEDQFIILASGSANNIDGGIIIDRGAYGNGNIAYGFDSATGRWGYQNGLTDTTNALDPTGTGTSGAFAGIVFTETAHTSTKPTTGEFVMAGAIYTNTDGTIWMFS